MPWTAGIHPVEELLTHDPAQVQEVWIVKSRRPGGARQRVRQLAEEAGVHFRLVQEQQLRAAVGEVNHQGVGARIADFEYADANALLAAPGPGLVIVLDEVQDPHNLGAVMRTACALGARGLVIPKHRAAAVTPAVRKVAAGAASRVKVARITNLTDFVDQAKEQRWWTYATVVEGGAPLVSTEFAERAVLVLGSEQKGVRPRVRSACDLEVTLAIDGLESLNVSVAAGIFAYEWVRQRRTSGD